MPDMLCDTRVWQPPSAVARDACAPARPVNPPYPIQELNNLILASGRDCVVVLSLEGDTLYVSPGGIQSMEISDAEPVLGTSWLRVWRGADLRAARAAIATARAGGIGRFEAFCATHKGTPKWWDVVISPLPRPDGRPARLLSVGRDITDRIHAQDRLAVSEDTLRLATEAGEIGTWDLDLRSGVLTPSGRVRVTADSATPGPFNLDDFYARIHPDDRAIIIAAFESVRDPLRRATYDVEYRLVVPPGAAERWVAAKGRGSFDTDGHCIRVTGTLIDITARKMSEARLRASEHALRELNATLEARVEVRTRERDRAWNNARDLLAIVDTGGVFRAANAAWTTILGWQPDEIVGRHFCELICPDDYPSCSAAFARITESERPGHENRYRHKAGGYRWISWLTAREGDMVYANGRHITAEKEAAAELAATQEKLRQSQKMEAVGQLTGGIAHDFNNLLTGITCGLEMLQSRVAQGRVGEIDRYVAGAMDAARRAAALTQRLLAFSRRQTLDPRPTDINRLVAGMVEMVERTVGPTIFIDLQAGAATWPALIDANQLENALLNLCINARDAMPDGGRLTIATANACLDAVGAAERAPPAREYVSLSVTDTGKGMAPEVVARAFDPFFTTKPPGHGTGLGLSMTHGFVTQSGGHVRIASEPGSGTTVRLLLPRHAGDPPALGHPASGGDIAPTRGSGTVLAVDDDAMVRAVLAEVLENAGYDVVAAADGAAALRVLQSDRRIDLLVTDVGLPGGLDGRQVADAGREVRPGLKVLFITGYAATAVTRLDPGMQILTKPFMTASLIEKIAQLNGQDA